jgi:hypothetical protein
MPGKPSSKKLGLDTSRFDARFLFTPSGSMKPRTVLNPESEQKLPPKFSELFSMKSAAQREGKTVIRETRGLVL